MNWTQANWRCLIERIRYKPNVTLSYRAVPGHRWSWLSIDSDVPDRDNPSKQLRVTFEKTLPLVTDRRIDDEASAVEWILETIIEWERHEADEWFRLDGKRVFEHHVGGIAAEDAR